MNLHPRLEADSDLLGYMNLCQVRLIRNKAFPWILLIPNQNDIVEITDLSENDQQQLMREIAQASKAMSTLYSPDKINVGALGNMVPQLHVHVIARFKDDGAWPGAVWGSGVDENYSDADLSATKDKLTKALNLAQQQQAA